MKKQIPSLITLILLLFLVTCGSQSGATERETAVAYPFSVLNDEPIVNDTVNDTDLLVVFNADAASGVVFDRQVDGQTLTFSAKDDDILIDSETGSTWNAFTGMATAGELEGAALERVKSTTIFWFGWKDFHPDTALYGIP